MVVVVTVAPKTDGQAGMEVSDHHVYPLKGSINQSRLLSRPIRSPQP